jgi:hypothetical protein
MKMFEVGHCKSDFEYLVVDYDDEPIRRFVSRKKANNFARRYGMKIVKINNVDWNNFEPAPF